MTRERNASSWDRRTLVKVAGGTVLTAATLGATRLPVKAAGGASPTGLRGPLAAGRQPADRMAELAIDLATEPATLDPALVYDADSWSVVHSVYDALVQYGPDGELQPLLAESLEQTDPLTWEARLRPGVVFHNGEPFDAASVAFSVAHIQDPATGSQVAANFAAIEAVEEVEPLLVRFRLSAPAPWLPAQMAAWLAMLPPAYAADPANDFAANPVGTGPYRFAAWERGREIRLDVNPDYAGDGPKGAPIAEAVRFRPVPEATTRVSDLLSRTSSLIRSVPVDQIEAVEEGAVLVAEPLSGSAWIRIPTDVAPFDDVRVRQALNFAVDVDGIVAALLAGNGDRLPNFFVEGGLGWDPGLKPYGYDPEQARALMSEAGYGKGFDTALEFAASEREEVVLAVAGQLFEVGVRVEARPVETATFNATWTDQAAAPLRFATWRPLFDPYTLLSLVVSSEGFLSRHDNVNVQKAIEAAAVEPDPATREKLYREVGRRLRDEPAAIYLYRLTGLYGLAADVPAWTPRADDYLIATVVGEG
jgi:peptide/nickel transport system substrate-binding protein